MTNRIPLLYKLAQNPPISPITPPPKLSRSAFLSSEAAVISDQIREQVSRFLLISPAGTLMNRQSSGSTVPMRGRQLDWVLVSVNTTNLEKEIWAKTPESASFASDVKITESTVKPGLIED